MELSTRAEMAEPRKGILRAASPTVLATAFPICSEPNPKEMSELRTTAPKIFMSFASEGRNPYRKTMSLIICKLTTATSNASVRELCDTAENAADFKEHLKMMSFADFFTLPL